MTKTWLFRGVVFGISYIAMTAIVALVDANVDFAWKTWTGVSSPRAIETGTFLVVTWLGLWRWISKRVWIGRKEIK